MSKNEEMKQMRKSDNTVRNMVMTAMMMCMVIVMTMIIRVPIPATQGYIHLGDCMIFFSVLLLGWKWGAVAAGVGSAMADIFAGYAYYAPVTLVVKGLMAVVMGLCVEYAIKHGFKGVKMIVMEVLGMAVAGLFMVAGYYVAEGVMYGNFVTPLASIPMNCLQFVVGVILATTLAYALGKTPAGKLFTYKLAEAV